MQPEDAGGAAEDAKGDRKSTFGLLFGFGTAMFLFGLLSSQVPIPPDRIPQLTLFVAATALLGAAALVGYRRMSKTAFSEWGFGPLSITILALELVWSLAAIGDFIAYEIRGR
jgi:hypothetical protein